MSDKITTLETRLSEAQSQYEKINTMLELAWELRTRDSSKSKSLTEQANELFKTTDLDEKDCQILTGHCYRNMAYHYFYASDFGAAMRHAKDALDIYVATGLVSHQTGPLGTLANALIAIGDYEAALTHSLQQLEIGEKLDDVPGTARALNGIGIVYSNMGKHEEALEKFEQCLGLYEVNDDLGGQARMYNNGMIEYMNLDQNEKALKAGLKSLALFESVDNLFGQSRIHGNLVRLYAKLKDYDKALWHGERSLALADEVDNKEHKTANLLYVGQLHLEMDNYKPAISNFQMALSIAIETGSLQRQYQCHEGLAIAYEGLKDFETALTHHKQFHVLKEKVFNDESATKLSNVQVRFQTKAAQQAAEFYQQRNKELEALREQDRLYFERLSDMKDEVVSTASHDLKSPLSTMSLLVYMLNGNETLDTSGHDLVQQLDRQIEQMRDLVIGLLDLAKLETGRALSTEPSPIVPFLNGIVQDIQPLADEKQIALQFVTNNDDIVADYDPLEIRRVVENLLSNAIKFTPTRGTVTLSIDGTDKVIVRVSDTGVGIPNEAIKHVFERFYRVSTDAQRAVDGTGLGLAIAKSIIEQHDGEIWVESVEGEGSTFVFTLPTSREPVQ